MSAQLFEQRCAACYIVDQLDEDTSGARGEHTLKHRVAPAVSFERPQGNTPARLGIADIERLREIWQAVLEAAPAGVAVFDHEMKYIEASSQWKRDYGLNEQPLLGRSHYEIFPDIPERWKEIHRRCLAGASEKCDADPFPRLDGETEWVRWEIRPWHRVSGDVGGIVIFSEVITERKVFESRLALLAHTSELFHGSLNLNATLDNVVKLATESFADLARTDVMPNRSARHLHSTAAARDPSLQGPFSQAGVFLHDDEYRMHPALRVLTTGETSFVPMLSDQIDAYAASARHARFMRQLAYRSQIIVPMIAQRQVFGALKFVRTGNRRPFNADDVNLAQELGRRAGLAVANAQRYEQEHHVAVTLQRAFASVTLPARPGIDFHAVYLSGNDEADIGGDWYDAFETEDGRLIITVGDVAGNGVEAARQMVQLRQSIRVAAVVTTAPDEMLAILNAALARDRVKRHASALVMVIAADNRSATYASAGHPPPLRRSNDGSISRLALPSPPLGIDRQARFEAFDLSLACGDSLLLYTDGAIEAFRDVTIGEARLSETFASRAFVIAANPARHMQRVLAGAQTHDDVALVALQFGESNVHWRFDAETPRSAYSAKATFLETLRSIHNQRPLDIAAAEAIFGELMGNVARHAPGPVSLTVAGDHSGWTLHVIDEGPGFEWSPSLPEDIWSEWGRGLFLIRAIARSIVVERLPSRGSYVAAGLPYLTGSALVPDVM